MSPEVFLRQEQTEMVDIWALGILLYEMIHKVTPFKNKNLNECFEIIKQK